MNQSIFFFDGVCGLCSKNVDFVLRHDKKKVFKVAPLQDKKAIDFFQSAGLPTPDYSTSILFHKGKFYYKSDVYFELMKGLDLPWSLMAIFQIVPKFIRDQVYDYIATNRHKIFGKLDSCRMPTSEEKERFL